MERVLPQDADEIADSPGKGDGEGLRVEADLRQNELIHDKEKQGADAAADLERE